MHTMEKGNNSQNKKYIKYIARESERILAGLESIAVDPIWKDILIDIQDTEDRIRAGGNAWNIVEELNFKWEDFIDTIQGVQVTGQLRVLDSDLEEYMSELPILEAYEKRMDSDGNAYWAIEDQWLRLQGFDEEEDEDGTVRVVLDLADPADDFATSWLFMMRPDEITSFAFSEPTIAAVDAHLKYYYPDMYNRVIGTKPIGAWAPEDKILEGLKAFHIPVDGHLDKVMLRGVGALLYSYMGGDDAPYIFSVNGEIKSIDEEGDDVSMELKGALTATLEGVLLEEATTPEGVSIYKPALVVAAAVNGHDGFYGCVLPVDSIESYRRGGNKKKLFGKVALQLFESTADISDDYFDDLGDFSMDAHQHPADTPRENDRIIEQIPTTSEGSLLTVYDRDSSHYEPIDACVQKVVSVCDESFAAVVGARPLANITLADYKRVECLMDEQPIEGLVEGAILRLKGDMMRIVHYANGGIYTSVLRKAEAYGIYAHATYVMADDLADSLQDLPEGLWKRAQTYVPLAALRLKDFRESDDDDEDDSQMETATIILLPGFTPEISRLKGEF